MYLGRADRGKSRWDSVIALLVFRKVCEGWLPKNFWKRRTALSANNPVRQKERKYYFITCNLYITIYFNLYITYIHYFLDHESISELLRLWCGTVFRDHFKDFSPFQIPTLEVLFTWECVYVTMRLSPVLIMPKHSILNTH